MESNKTTDVQVQELFDLVQKRKAEIEKAEKPCWQTSGNFGFVANSAHDRMNIQTIEDYRKLVEIYSFLIGREKNHKEATEDLGVSLEFSWLGFAIGEWKSDIVTRMNQIQIKTKRKQLSELEARLNAIISPELRAKMEVDAIKKLLEENK